MEEFIMIWAVLYVVGFLFVWNMLLEDVRWECVKSKAAEFSFITFLSALWPIGAAALALLCIAAFAIPLIMVTADQVERFFKAVK